MIFTETYAAFDSRNRRIYFDPGKIGKFNSIQEIDKILSLNGEAMSEFFLAIANSK